MSSLIRDQRPCVRSRDWVSLAIYLTFGFINPFIFAFGIYVSSSLASGLALR